MTIKKLIENIHSIFDELSVALLVCLVFLVIYAALLRIVGMLPDFGKSIVVIGAPVLVLFLLVLSIRKKNVTVWKVIDLIIIMIGFIALSKALRFITKLF